jgi:hypothetical protein
MFWRSIVSLKLPLYKPKAQMYSKIFLGLLSGIASSDHVALRCSFASFRPKYRKIFRLHIAIQICAVRLYGRFLNQVHDLSPHIVSYLSQQLNLAPSLTVQVPTREATYLEQRQNVLKYLGFQRFDEFAQSKLELGWSNRPGLASCQKNYSSKLNTIY